MIKILFVLILMMAQLANGQSIEGYIGGNQNKHLEYNTGYARFNYTSIQGASVGVALDNVRPLARAFRFSLQIDNFGGEWLLIEKGHSSQGVYNKTMLSVGVYPVNIPIAGKIGQLSLGYFYGRLLHETFSGVESGVTSTRALDELYDSIGKEKSHGAELRLLFTIPMSAKLSFVPQCALYFSPSSDVYTISSTIVMRPFIGLGLKSIL
jgi:hypothetical protein